MNFEITCFRTAARAALGVRVRVKIKVVLRPRNGEMRNEKLEIKKWKWKWSSLDKQVFDCESKYSIGVIVNHKGPDSVV